MEVKDLQEKLNIADTLYKQEKYLQAKDIYKECYEMMRECNDIDEADVLEVIYNFGICTANIGEIDEALNIFAYCFKVGSKIFGGSHPNTLAIMSNIAVCAESLGLYQKAIELNEILYELRKDVLGEKDPDTLNTLNNLASNYECVGNYHKALELSSMCYKLMEEVLGKKHPDTLNCLNNIADIYHQIGKYQEALVLNKECYELRKEVLGEKNTFTLTSLGNLALNYATLGNYQNALRLNQHCYESRKEVLGEKHPDTLSSLNNLAGDYVNIGDYQKALKLNQQSYELTKEILGEDHPDTIYTLNNLADIYVKLGKYQKALKLNQRCYELSKDVFGANHPTTLTILNNLANIYDMIGHYQEAIKLYKQCYELSKEISGEKYLETITFLNNLSVVYTKVGNYEEALNLSKTCYELSKEVLGEKHPTTLSIMNNLANSYAKVGNYQLALNLYTLCYKLNKEVLGEKHPAILNNLNNLADTYNNLNNYHAALKLQKQCYELSKEVLGEKNFYTLSYMSNLATLYNMIGQYKEALKLFKQCYELSKDVMGQNHPNILNVINNLSFCYYLNNNNEKYYDYSTRYFDSMNNEMDYMIEMIQNSNYKNLLEEFIRTHTIHKNYYFNFNNKESGYHYIVAYKNIIQDIEMIEYSLRKLPGYNEKVNYLNEINKQLLDHRDINNILELQKTREKLNNQITKITSQYQDTLNLDINAKKIQSHLKETDLLLDIYELDGKKYELAMVGHDSFKTCIFKNVEELQNILEEYQNITHLYVCPDGELYNVSFERYISDYEITYLSSPKALFYTYDDNDNDDVVSFVYPDFNDMMDDSNNERGEQVGVLFGSYLEGQSIHNIYHEKNHLYKEKEANYHNFMEVNHPKVFHISTHGMYEKDHPGDLMERGKLCLAGYNIDDKPEDYGNGYVTAGEIQSMNLKGTDLVVLSACNTGIGTTIRGEGLYGIRRAFELAGAKTMILTVEEVDDYNTAIFMKVFYEFYQKTNKIYESFKATREYLNDTNHALKELEELRDMFSSEMKDKIARSAYRRRVRDLNDRIEEVKNRNYMVRLKKEGYVLEDWKGVILQGKVED